MHIKEGITKLFLRFPWLRPPVYLIGGIVGLVVGGVILLNGVSIATDFVKSIISGDSVDPNAPNNPPGVVVSIIDVKAPYEEGDKFLLEGNIEQARVTYGSVFEAQGTLNDELAIRFALTLPLERKIRELVAISAQDSRINEVRARSLEAIALMYMQSENEEEKAIINNIVFAGMPLSLFYDGEDDARAYAKLMERASAIHTVPLAEVIIANYYFDLADSTTKEQREDITRFRAIGEQHLASAESNKNNQSTTVLADYTNQLNRLLSEAQAK